ncbi:MAG: hypothetical protein KDA89_21620 [Planctomycetaceae bacterium]|nr:hypothetical protein [Planctomycetaceae bacterium]
MTLLTEQPHAPAVQHSSADGITLRRFEPSAERLTAHRVAGLLLLSVLPFLAVPLCHVVSSPETATGFFHYELPYYVANGRSAFEHGNGILYPNPYDPRPESPVIYCHWLPWVLGLATAVCGFDPGDTFLIFTFAASLIFAWSTRRLILLRLRGSEPIPSRKPMSDLNEIRRLPDSVWFLAVMWGGGLLVFGGVVETAVLAFADVSGGFDTWEDQLLRFDPGRGMWFLNWGRNALFPTEAVYHSLAAACWVSEIRGRGRWANGFLVLLATTHPWSGLELLLTITLFRTVQLYMAQFAPGAPTDRPRRSGRGEPVRQLWFSVSVLVLFLLYYKVWLPSFAAHAELQSVWELNWSLSGTSALLAYALVLPAAMIRIRSVLRNRRNLSSSGPDLFLMCALLTAAVLAFHDRLIRPVQPLHFTRGYLWMPLFLLGLPVLREWTDRIPRTAATTCLVGLIGVVAALDNLTFAVIHGRRQFRQEDGFHLSLEDRVLLQALCEERTIGNRPHQTSAVVMSESETINYLLPAYTSLKPWLGHQFNTPDFPRRKEQWQKCFTQDGIVASEIPIDVRIVLARKISGAAAFAEDNLWEPLALSNTEWQGWRRRNAPDQEDLQ